jgi:hypothetical protein
MVGVDEVDAERDMAHQHLPRARLRQRHLIAAQRLGASGGVDADGQRHAPKLNPGADGADAAECRPARGSLSALLRLARAACPTLPGLDSIGVRRANTRMLRSLATFSLLLCLLSCAATREHFIPREDVRAQSPRGWPAAQYPITIGGENVGEAKVWSEGTFRADVEGDKRTILHIGFEVENRSGAELDFDVDKCRVVDVQGDDGRMADMAAHDESGQLHVAVGQVGLIDLEFVLPLGSNPRDLDTFRVEWTLASPSGQFVQSTPFRVDTTRYYRPRYYYYDPWWGFGTGFALGHASGHFWWGPHWHWHRWCW